MWYFSCKKEFGFLKTGGIHKYIIILISTRNFMEVQKPSDSEHFGEFPQQFLKLNALEEASSSDTEEKDKFA